MDITGLPILEEASGIRIILCEANDLVREKLEKAGIHATIEPEGNFDSYYSM